jgi:phage host-nuclease inhibitor protein Gam
MAKAKPKKLKTGLPLPQTVEQVNEYITAVADAQRAINQEVSRANRLLARLKERLAARTAPHERDLATHAAALFEYFEKNRPELIGDGQRQSCEFAAGILGQRRTPPRTKFTDEDAIKIFVVEHELEQFYKEEVTLLRQAMLADPETAATIPGVSIVRDRIIYVQPDQFDTEIVLKTKVEAA